MNRRSLVPPATAAPTNTRAAYAIAIGVWLLTALPARAEEMVSLPRTGPYRIIPSSVQFANGYAADVQRDPPRFADPVDTDTIAEVQLFARPARGPAFVLGVDDESKRIGPGGTLVRFTFEWRF